MIPSVSKEENEKLLELIEDVELIDQFFQQGDLEVEDIPIYKQSLLNVNLYLKSEQFNKIKNGFFLVDTDDLLNLLIQLYDTYTIQGIELARNNFNNLKIKHTDYFIKTLQEKLRKLIQNPYDIWRYEQQSLIQKLKDEYWENEGYSFVLIKQLYNEFSKFIGPKLTVKFVSSSSKNYKFEPVYFFNGEYKEIKNPITNSRWFVSGNPTNYKEQLDRLARGTIIKVDYHLINSKKPQYYESLLSLDYKNFSIIGNDFQMVIKDYFTETELRELTTKFGIRFNHLTMLEKEFIKLLLPTSERFKEKLNNARSSIEQIKTEIEKIEIQKQSFYDKMNLEIEALENEKNEFYNQQNEIKNKLTEDQKRWLETLQSIDYEYEEIKLPEKFIEYNEDTFFEDLQSSIYNLQDGLLYDENILEVIINALRSNILTILSGPSGTGKSSLIEALGEAIVNVKTTLIPVQSSWTDAHDLLGYFHPNEKVFVATPFMESLAQARLAEINNKDELHIICLDEMNLAHIEYYFAQFLSLREQKEKVLQLYPKHYYHWACDVVESDDTDLYTKQKAKELLTKYPAIFKIPSNVRFIGTLNMDHTVKSLSPKVIDRSLIVEMLKLSEEQKKEIEGKITENNNSLPIKLQLNEFLTSNGEYDQTAYDNILGISNIFQNFRDIPLNGRGEKHLKDILSYWKNPSNIIVDLLIKGKVLPRIQVKKSEIENLQILNALRNYPNSYNKMTEMLKTSHTVSFW